MLQSLLTMFALLQGFHFSLELLYCAHLIVPLAMPKVLSFDNKNKKCPFYFVLCSLNRTFAPQLVLLHIIFGVVW